MCSRLHLSYAEPKRQSTTQRDGTRTVRLQPQPNMRWNQTNQHIRREAIVSFLESMDFESAVRLAVSIGGDSDTIAAITGSIAEAYYGIPQPIKEKA